MTITELERYTYIARMMKTDQENTEYDDSVLALITDYRIMRQLLDSMVSSEQWNYLSEAAELTISNTLKTLSLQL